ncbi:MAG: O-antigen ligase family protein [Candidatus Hydrogenedentota bacterium]|mgnify:CR=1 FL=1
MISNPGRLAVATGVFILATGGLFGWNENSSWSDLIPALAGAALLALSIPGQASRLSRASLIPLFCMMAMAVLTWDSPRECISWLLVTVSFAAGLHSRHDDLVRRTVLGACFLLLLLACYQRWILFPWLAPQLEGEARGRLLSGRTFSSFMLPAQFSAYLALVLPLAVAVALTDRHRRAHKIMAILIPAGFVLAGSLSGVVAALAALVVLQAGSRRFTRIHLLMLIALLGVLAFRFDALILSSSSYSMRWNTWHATLLGSTESLWTGHGSGSFEQIFMTRYWMEGSDEVRHPHSWPLKILFEQGLAGLFLWIVAVAPLFARLRDRSFRAAAFAFVIACLLDVADLSLTLRSLAFFLLGSSLSPDPESKSP